MAQGEELAIEFYPPGDAQGLADCLADFLQNTEKQHRMAVQNFSAGLRMTMPNVVQKYIRHFELQQRVQTLRYVSRFRRLPRWIPSKSLLLRLMTRNSLGWARRSTMIHAPWNGHAEPELFNGNGNGSSGLKGSGVAVNGDRISTHGRAGDYGLHAVPAARDAANPSPISISLRLALPMKVMPNSPKLNSPVAKKKLRRSLRFADTGTTVLKVSTELTAPAPGVTDAGENEQLRLFGSSEQVKATA